MAMKKPLSPVEQVQKRVTGPQQEKATTWNAERKIRTLSNVHEEPAKANEICDICLKEITECTKETTGDQALLCEGRCHWWMHNWCAAVPEAQCRLLSASDDPFLCPACLHDSQKCEINLLKGMIEALRTEVVQLKEHLHSCRTQNQKENSNPIHNDMVKEAVDTSQADSVPNEPGCEGWSQVLSRKAKATFAQTLARKGKPKKGKDNGNKESNNQNSHPKNYHQPGQPDKDTTVLLQDNKKLQDKPTTRELFQMLMEFGVPFEAVQLLPSKIQYPNSLT